jgi:hypothetical protein
VVLNSFNGGSYNDLERGTVASGGRCDFVEAASFDGNLIECDLVDHELVRLHLIKPLNIDDPRVHLSPGSSRT